MPTLFRFVVFTAMLAGILYGTVYVLAEYFPPEQKEISKTLRNVTVKD